MKVKRFFTSVLAISSVLAVAALPGEGMAETLKFSTPTPPPHIMTKGANRIAEGLNKASGGEIKVKVHPLNQLGNIPTVLSLLRSGALELAMAPAGDLARMDEAFYAWGLPYLFESVEEAGKAIQTPAARKILDRLESQGLVGLGYVFPGQRHVLSTFPLNSTDDLKSKKVRAFPNQAFETWWSEVGAAPTALPLPEIAPSLMTGVLDAVDVDLDIVVGLKFHKHAPHLALTNHMSFAGVILASKKWWDSLSDERRAMIREQISETESWAVGEQARAEVSNLEKLKADGVTVSDVDTAEFRAIGKKVRDAFLKRDPLIEEFYSQVTE